MKFYRYVAVEYASLGVDGDYESSKFPNPKLELRDYDLIKETPKGYWIGYGFYIPNNLRGNAKWVSKTGRKRYAYPTKEEALENYIKRTQKRIKILERQAWTCKITLGLAENMQKRLEVENK